jgi:hypothetical protein
MNQIEAAILDAIAQMARLDGEEPSEETQQEVYGKVYELLGLTLREGSGYRDEAEETLKQFMTSLVKLKGITISEASRAYTVPMDFFWRWSERGLIRVLQKGRPGAPTYLDKQSVQETALIYHQAREEGIQPIRLLERMRQDAGEK